MADQFFEFQTDLPESSDLLQNDLIEASVDHHEIDLVNDETFGDCEEEWNYDDQGELPGDGEEDVPVETMEKSISQLVVDDDDLIDPAIVDARTRPKSIPHRGAQDLDQLFGPSSPPSLLDTDALVSPDHHNIWRPSRNSPAHPLIAQHSSNNHNQQHFHDPSIVTAGGAFRMGFQNAGGLKDPSIVTAGDVFHVGFHNSPGLVAPGHQTPNRAGPYTLEEVERRIRNESPLPDNGRNSPQLLKNMSRALPVQYREPLTPGGESPFGRLSPGPGVLSHPGQAPVGTPARNRMPPGPPGTPLGQMPPRMPYNPMTPRPGVYGMPKGPYPVNMGPRHIGQGDGPWSPGPQHGMHTPRVPRPFMRAPYTDPGLIRHHAMRDPRFQHPQHPQHMMEADRRQQEYGYRDQRDPRLNQSHYVDRRDHHNYTRMTNSPRDSPRDHRDDPEYMGPDSLMTQREKDWVIKIQMLQLHTDNPYIDDYYYMQFKMKQLAAERKKQKVGVQSQQKEDDTPRLLLPQLQHIEARHYTPAQFEGVLGRLTASSVHNPRPVIDCKINVSHSDEGNLKGTKYKQVLVFVEKLYDVLLDVDDLEKRMLASAEDSHPKILEERRHKLDGFYLSLDCESNSSLKFNSLMCIRKGKMLINRVLPLMTEEQGYKVVDNMLKQLPILIKKDVADEILPTMFEHVATIIVSCDMKNVVHLAESLLTAAVPTSQTNPLLTAIQNKFGLSVVCSMLQRCETIYVNEPLEIDNSLRESWSKFVSELAERLIQANERSLPLPKPLAKFENLAGHMERCLDKKTILSVEEVLKTWS